MLQVSGTLVYYSTSANWITCCELVLGQSLKSKVRVCGSFLVVFVVIN